MAINNSAAAPRRRFPGIIVFALFSLLVGLVIVAHDNVPAFALEESSSLIRIRDHTLAFYRAPEHAHPPLNLLDPYDSFLKDADGNLIIESAGKSLFSNFTQSDYRGYVMKTRKGTPVLVYQDTPVRRQRHKSNCHGLTFLDGDYWMMGSQVDRILIDNDWVAVTEAKAQVGDVAIYQDLKGRITHTARVTGRDPSGHILVNSKNGFDQEVRCVRAVDVVPR
jgi:hypothetical protein